MASALKEMEFNSKLQVSLDRHSQLRILVITVQARYRIIPFRNFPQFLSRGKLN